MAAISHVSQLTHIWDKILGQTRPVKQSCARNIRNDPDMAATCDSCATYGVQYTWARKALHAAVTGACPALPRCSKGYSHPPLRSVL